MMCRTPILVMAALVMLPGRNQSVHLLAREPVPSHANLAVAINEEFALSLYRQLANEQEGKNLFFSPFSLSVALIMASEGARGETALQMGKALHLPASLQRAGADGADIPWDLSAIHTAMATLIDRFSTTKQVPQGNRGRLEQLRAELNEVNARVARLQKEKGGSLRELREEVAKGEKLAREVNMMLTQMGQYELRLANALWVEKSYPFQKSYVETIQRYYGPGRAVPVDFVGNSEGARKQINGWVEEQTGSRIKELILPKAVDQVTRLVLTNAIYFKGEWVDRF